MLTCSGSLTDAAGAPTPATGPPPELYAARPTVSPLRARSEDLGAMWSAHACRRRQEVPVKLAWAAQLLDHPLTVLCAREQARALIVWHHHLPTYVSFTAERRARSGGTSARR